MKHSSAYINKENKINLRAIFFFFLPIFVSSIGLSKTPRNSKLNMDTKLKDHKKLVTLSDAWEMSYSNELQKHLSFFFFF